MTNEHFASPELSKRLTDLGVVSEFIYAWNKRTLDGKLKDKWKFCTTKPDIELDSYCIRAIHFSDILLPQNARKIWGRHEDLQSKTQILLLNVQLAITQGDWQLFLSNQLDEKL